MNIECVCGKEKDGRDVCIFLCAYLLDWVFHCIVTAIVETL